jgi:triphosphoribosyl-dephospho-CoA synthase
MFRPLPQNGILPGAATTLACVYEATAPKPGNVHPGLGFEDSTDYAHFVSSAVAIGPILERAGESGVGRTVLDGVQATRRAVRTNTNLGTLLLIAPMAAVPNDYSLADGIDAILNALTDDDTSFVYEAIRCSKAGGLGRSEDADVNAEAAPKISLVTAMRIAADRDLVARQYTNAFADVFEGPTVWIAEGIEAGWPLSQAIVHAHVRQIARHGDSLIARKCGASLSAEASERAKAVLQSGLPECLEYESALADFDGWLRADGHRRNPGTSADFIAAGLFVLLREGRLNWQIW